MKQYIFILGQSANLAQQEIINLLTKPDDTIKEFGPGFVIAETNQDPKKLLSSLGGTIKIAEYLDKISNLSQLTITNWLDYLPNEEKIHFGFSLYNDNNKNYHSLFKLALSVKKELKNKISRVRFVTSKSAQLSSVIITKNNLLNKELIIIKNEQSWILGITKAVQDFESYGQRDIDRPHRDDRSGLLPPKVAQMMLNLAGPDRNKTILDPFSGSGTILAEAALLKFKEIYGRDYSQKAIQDSQANLDWLKKHFDVSSKIDLKKTDVKNLSQDFSKQSIDLIVTEPFMGDAQVLKRENPANVLDKIKSELQELYLQAFSEFKKIIKKEGQIIFVFPIFINKQKKFYTLNQKMISNLGFNLIKPTIKADGLSPDGNLIYSRPGQKVKREITIWKPKN